MTIPFSKIKLILFLAFLIAFYSLASSAQTLQMIGESKEKNHQGKSWFQMIIKSQQDRETTSFIDSQGKVLSEEVIIWKGETVEYLWTQNQMNKKIELVFSKDKIIFNKKDEIRISKEDQGKIVLPSMIFSFLQKNIKSNPNSTSFPITVIVPDKEILVDFTFQKDDKFWVLKADQLFIRLMVKPVKFLMNERGHLAEIQDLTPPIQFETKSKALETRMTDIIFTQNFK